MTRSKSVNEEKPKTNLVLTDDRRIRSFQANLADDDVDHLEVQQNGDDGEQGAGAGVDLKIEHKHTEQDGERVRQGEEVVVAGGPALQSHGDFDCKREVD